MSPGYASGHQWYGFYLGNVGRLQEGIREIERARELDPLSLIIHSNGAMLLNWAGRHDQAEAALRRALELDPDFVAIILELGFTLEAQSKFEDAIEAYGRAFELSGGLIGLAELGHLYGVMGRRAEALEMLGRLEEEAEVRYVAPVELAILNAGLGNTDAAFAWLEEGYRRRDATLTWRIFTPGLYELRSDPRFADLLRRLGLSAGL